MNISLWVVVVCDQPPLGHSVRVEAGGRLPGPITRHPGHLQQEFVSLSLSLFISQKKKGSLTCFISYLLYFALLKRPAITVIFTAVVLSLNIL